MAKSRSGHLGNITGSLGNVEHYNSKYGEIVRNKPLHLAKTSFLLSIEFMQDCQVPLSSGLTSVTNRLKLGLPLLKLLLTLIKLELSFITPDVACLLALIAICSK